MTEEKEKEKIKFNPDQTSTWLWYMEKTLEFDKNIKMSKGWHWFWGLYYLREHIENLDFAEISAMLPDSHWLNTALKEQKEYEAKVVQMKRDRRPNHPIFLPPNPKMNSREFIKEWVETFEITKKITKISFYKEPFDKSVDFSNFIFPVETDFRGVIFYKNAILKNTVFWEKTDFENVQFHGDTAKFRNAIFEKIANFKDAKFNGYANFKGAIFKGRTSFQKAEFKYHAPRFYGATLNNEITWTDIELPKFEKINHNKPNKESEDAYKKRLVENQNSYENLSILLDDYKKYHDRHFFFREELRCRRWLERGSLRPFYILYSILADYGYGMGRAFCWWAGHIAVWAVILMFFNYQKDSMVESPFLCSVLTSAINAHSFLLSKGAKMANCYDMAKHKLALDLIWAGEAILGAMFLFLVLLTLRVRFRLK